MQSNAKKHAARGFILALTVFLAVAFILTFNVISLPSLVIGDNFNWTPQNVLDITGPKIIRESYMGDIGVLSTFKTGFLFPLAYLVVSLSLPSTLVYPFLFYILSMLSFYFLSKEFLKNEALRIAISILYVVNPVTPYYFASLINAFSLVLLPLGIKYFVKTLREVERPNRPFILKNFVLTAFFLSLCVSANEQFVFSFALVSVFMIATMSVVLFKKIPSMGAFAKSLSLNLLAFASIFSFVNLPLFLSTSNIQKTPWSTYFQGPASSQFVPMIDFSYRNADLTNLIRLGGDGGTGLGQNAWYDSTLLTNVFGYALFILFVVSVLVLLLKKNDFKTDRPFFYQSFLLFVVTLAIILFIKSFPGTVASAGAPFDSLLKTWESPTKLRAVLLVALLASTLVAFCAFEAIAKSTKRKIIVGVTVGLILASAVVYNSPWLVSYAGQTTMQEIAGSSGWGSLYQQEYANLSQAIQDSGTQERGIILPYTHEAELYSDPNSRVFQLISSVNEQTSELIAEKNVAWSKTLGLLSIKQVAVNNNYSSGENQIFPSTKNIGLNGAIGEIRNDSGFTTITNNISNYQILDNQNALPILYASNHYVYYDNIGTLKYALNYTDFKNLPVFIQSASKSGIELPPYITADNYTVYALALHQNQGNYSLPIKVSNNQTSKNLLLEFKGNSQNVFEYSTSLLMHPGDHIEVPQNSLKRYFNDVTLNTSNMLLGTIGDFSLNFKVNVLQKGEYSFLGPRVVLDSGTEQYYIIIHDNGLLELAVMQDGSFKSALATNFAGYNLQNPNNELNIEVTRSFDEVKVYVGTTLYLSFNVTPQSAKVYLTSEHSISKFSEIEMSQSAAVRLFAVRQNLVTPSYTVQQRNPEASALTVFSNGADFAVVSQYLYNQLTHADSRVSSNEIAANVFFKGWVFASSNQTSNSINISITMDNRAIELSLLSFSITFSYAAILLLLAPAKVKSALWKQLNRIKAKKIVGSKTK